MSEHDTLAAALVAALSELTNVAKGHTANAGKKVYTYTNISDLIAETRPALAEHGIVALTPIHDHPEGMACTVVLLHKSGDRLDFGPFPFPSKGMDAQTTGSWVTYIRRYALLSALGMGAEDDDGAKAQPRQRETQRTAPPSGIDSEAMFERLTQHVAERIEDPDGEHAKAIWKAAKPKAVAGLIPGDEQARVLSVADEHIANLGGEEPF